MELGPPGVALVLVAFVVLLALCVAALTFVPAYILWKKTKDKRYPMMWVTCSALTVAFAALQAFVFGPDFSPRPTPINETFADVVDKSGALRVTALRVPNPEQPQVRIEVDAENTGEEAALLGIQCTTSSGQSGPAAPKQATSHYIWNVEPKWKGTLTCEAQLPGILYDGEVTIVLARCKSKTPTDNNWLPADSEALWQKRLSLLPDREATQP